MKMDINAMKEHFAKKRACKYYGVKSPETPENVAKIKALLLKVIEDKQGPTDMEDRYFWDSCYPWVQDNAETEDLLIKAYKSLPIEEKLRTD